jgi:hypothetical protein
MTEASQAQDPLDNDVFRNAGFTTKPATDTLAPLNITALKPNVSSLFPLAQPPLIVIPTATKNITNLTDSGDSILIDHPLPTPTCLFCIPRHSMRNLLPAILILLALILITGVALIISFRRHRSPSSSFFSKASWSKSAHPLPPPTTSTASPYRDNLQPFLHPTTRTPSPYHAFLLDSQTKLNPSVSITETHFGPPPGTTYTLPTHQQQPQLKITHHPSLKRKRALPAVAARSAYALPVSAANGHVQKPGDGGGGKEAGKGRDEARSPTHSGADWIGVLGSHTDDGVKQNRNANYEDMHLGFKANRGGAGSAPTFTLTGATASTEDARGHERTASESVWAEKARRVAERQMVEEQEREELVRRGKGLEAFDFEREEAGTRDGKGRKDNGGAGGRFKGWKVSLFGKSELAG